MQLKRHIKQAMVGIGIMAAAMCHAKEAPFPSKAVTIVSPYGAGGSSDALVRSVADKLTKAWGQPVLIENRTGANGIIATQTVMRAAPDGHTILLHLTGFIQNASLYKKLPYDPFKDLSPVTQVGFQAMGLAVAPSAPFESVTTLISALKAKPQDFSYGSFGTGSTGHIFGEVLKANQKLNIPHVAYRGEAPMLPDLISGRITFGFVSAATAVTRQKDKSLKILAVTGPKRLPMLPDVPTLGELGHADFDLVGWYGFFVPANTPKQTIDKIAADVKAAIAHPDIQARMQELTIEPKTTSPDEFSKILQSDFAKWDRLIKQVNIELE